MRLGHLYLKRIFLRVRDILYLCCFLGYACTCMYSCFQLSRLGGLVALAD